ncbi:hypothetical protein N665_1361s0007 [Sinapis alba]|nr:hypothetical protein N665_1361s0007 [Sinapis alba]
MGSPSTETKSSNYVVIDRKLHRWTANKVLLTCVSLEKAELVMAETHEEGSGNNSSGQALTLKIKTMDQFWPTMIADYETLSRKCYKCQRHTLTIHPPTELLQTIATPYPFMRWVMDIIMPLPSSRQRRFVHVLTDYFTKWVETEAFIQVTDKELQHFV